MNPTAKRILIGSGIGLVLGIVLLFALFDYIVSTDLYESIIGQPVFELNKMVTGCTQDCYSLIFVHWFIFIFFFMIIGALIGSMLLNRFIEKFALWSLVAAIPIFLVILFLQGLVCPSSYPMCITSSLGFIEPSGTADGYPIFAIWLLQVALYGFIIGEITGFSIYKLRTK